MTNLPPLLLDKRMTVSPKASFKTAREANFLLAPKMLSEVTAQSNRLLSQKDFNWFFEYNEVKYSLKPNSDNTNKPDKYVRINANWDGNVFALFFDAQKISKYINDNCRKIDFSTTSAKTNAVIFEHFLTTLFLQFEEDFGGNLILDEVYLTSHQGPDDSISFVITTKKEAISVLLYSPNVSNIVKRLTGKFDTKEKRSSIAVKTDILLCSPAIEIEQRDLCDLKTGDLLSLSNGWDWQKNATVQISNHAIAPARFMDKNYEISGNFSLLNSFTSGVSMKTDNMNRTKVLDSLPVVMSIEMDRIEIPYDEVLTLREGYVLPFTTTQPEQVNLLANGQVFASGELVQVGSKIAVKINGIK